MSETTAIAGTLPMVIGQRYRVPCLYVSERARMLWMPNDGFVPVLGPKHEDMEHLQFGLQHYHVDWRFVSERQYRVACHAYLGFSDTPLARVVTNDGTAPPGIERTVTRAPVLKIRSMKRDMPIFPDLFERSADTRKRWATLEQAHACMKLKPGGICPHRGIDLKQFAQPDGTAVCPGHGLRWNLTTGELVRRFSVAPAADSPHRVT